VIEEVEDLRGVFVKVGDTIAYAATDGRSGGMRVGTVLEIVPEHPSPNGYSNVPTKLRVSVEHSSGYWYKDAKPTLIQADFKRFVRIG
jgi:hypothetical protein